eukprot:gene467-873_t
MAGVLGFIPVKQGMNRHSPVRLSMKKIDENRKSPANLVISDTIFYLRALSVASMIPVSVLAADPDVSSIAIARPTLDIFVSALSLIFVLRTVMSWFPNTDLKKAPYSIIAWLTEPLLIPVRSLIPPAFGVDISSIVWVMVLSFFREVVTGPQGILMLIEKS